MNQERFSKTIKELRIKNNLTQKEFADKLGITYQAVSKWETGKNMPDIILLKEISSIFNIDIDELLTGEKKQSNNNIKILFICLLLLFCIVSILIIIKYKNSNFEFKTMTSSCNDFTLTGSAAYNENKTAIYISNVDYCGEEDNTIYKNIECNLYEKYNNTETKISSCGNNNINQTLDEFIDTVTINVDNYIASCKMFSSSTLYMEIKATNEKEKIITYQIPISLEENCK